MLANGCSHSPHITQHNSRATTFLAIFSGHRFRRTPTQSVIGGFSLHCEWFYGCVTTILLIDRDSPGRVPCRPLGAALTSPPCPAQSWPGLSAQNYKSPSSRSLVHTLFGHWTDLIGLHWQIDLIELEQCPISRTELYVVSTRGWPWIASDKDQIH